MNTLTEWFWAQEHLSSAIGLREDEATLCVGCFEELLGRELQPEDFAASEPPDDLLASERLRTRMGLAAIDRDEAALAGGLVWTSKPNPSATDEGWLDAH